MFVSILTNKKGKVNKTLPFLLICVEKSYNSIFSPFVEMNAYWLTA